METRMMKVVMLAIFLSVIMFSLTVLQYDRSPIVPNKLQARPRPRARLGTRADSDELVTIESCWGVEEPTEENVRWKILKDLSKISYQLAVEMIISEGSLLYLYRDCSL